MNRIMQTLIQPLYRPQVFTCFFVNMNRYLTPIMTDCAGASHMHTSTPNYLRNGVDRTAMLKDQQQAVLPDQEVENDLSMTGIQSPFPTAETHSTMFNGIVFTELPIVHIKTTKNNTITSLTNAAGRVLQMSSGGLEGFANAKKGTNIAAQATGVTVGKRALKMKIDTVRVCVQGIGPGRLPTIKGLQMAGLNIISITDTTPIVSQRRKVRKQRRL